MNRPIYYILDDQHRVVATDDVMRWARFLEHGLTVVGKDHVGKGIVSTIFMGLDHNVGGEGPPLLFETMVFELPGVDMQRRYSTWEEAERGHHDIVEALKRGE